MFARICIILFVAFMPMIAGKVQTRAVSKVMKVPTAKSKLYLGIGYGWMRLKDDYTLEHFETYPLLLLVGYRINDYFSIEARYQRGLGKVKYENGNTANPDNNDFPTKFTNIGIYLKPEYILNDKLSLYGLLGYGKVKLTNIKGADRYEKGIQWGAGLSYKMSDHISGFMDYIRIYGGNGFGGRAKVRYDHVDSVSVGVSYAF